MKINVILKDVLKADTFIKIVFVFLLEIPIVSTNFPDKPRTQSVCVAVVLNSARSARVRNGMQLVNGQRYVIIVSIYPHCNLSQTKFYIHMFHNS